MVKSKSARFTPLEVQKLLEEVEQYKDVLLCKLKGKDLKSECRLFKRNQSATGGGPKTPEPFYFDIIMDILGPDTTYWEGIKEKAVEPLPPSGWDVAGVSGVSECEIVIELPADTLHLPVEDFLDMAVAEATIQNCHDQSGPSQAISLPQAAEPETGEKN
ncbi:hypothetical protein PoB_000566100 [Plakobranchus ocellatus]|uniref:Uncharacterized protein n=1 Tax=Plakobranchus ocellatus TaxID=259542 RepID=A0AAV3Y7F5_9GAST|nr:hypothetical protein PoB_000566100 [Plakobranchus ocellatus]